MKKLIVLLLSVFLLYSCHKKETLFVTVKNVVTGEPLANNMISIVEETNIKDGAGSKTNDFYSGLTNSDGVIQITKKFNENWRYYVYLGEFSEEVCYVNTGQYLWSVGEETQLEFLYAPCSYLRLFINNVNCQNANDKIVIFQGNQINTFDYSYPWEHNGCVNWESNGYSDIPMGKQYYKWEVTKNGVTTTYFDTITLNAGEYKTYTINY